MIATLDKLRDSINVVLVEPVNDEAVWREQFQRLRVFNRMQRPDPGIKLLLRQLRLQFAYTMIPE